MCVCVCVCVCVSEMQMYFCVFIVLKPPPLWAQCHLQMCNLVCYFKTCWWIFLCLWRYELAVNVSRLFTRSMPGIFLQIDVFVSVNNFLHQTQLVMALDQIMMILYDTLKDLYLVVKICKTFFVMQVIAMWEILYFFSQRSCSKSHNNKTIQNKQLKKTGK